MIAKPGERETAGGISAARYQHLLLARQELAEKRAFVDDLRRSLGAELLSARRSVRHGDWGLWLEARGISRREAHRCMRMALAAGLAAGGEAKRQ